MPNDVSSVSGNGLYLSRHFQNAYTTRDLDTAVAMFSARYGIGAFHYMRNVPFGTDGIINLALAWAGGVMIELIEPQCPIDNLYTVHLPDDQSLIRFHHLGHLIHSRDEYDAICDRAATCGHPIALQGNNHGINFLYLDARADVGHYLEFVHLDPSMANFFAAVPRN